MKRMYRKSHYLFCFLTLIFLMVFLQVIHGEEAKHLITDSELQHINDLVANLKSQNETLNAQLQKSQMDVGELNKQLDEMKVQITNLKNMLVAANLEITNLKGQAETSEEEAQKLLDSLHKAENSLTDLDKSIKATRKQLNSLVWQRNIAIIITVVVLISRLA